MDGIQIISEQVVHKVPLSSLISTISIFCIAAIVLIPYSVHCAKKIEDKSGKIFIAILGLVFIGVAVYYSIQQYMGYTEVHQQLTIRIEDEARFNEFYDTFNVISQDGDIYVVEYKGG